MFCNTRWYHLRPVTFLTAFLCRHFREVIVEVFQLREDEAASEGLIVICHMRSSPFRNNSEFVGFGCVLARQLATEISDRWIFTWIVAVKVSMFQGHLCCHS